MNIIFQNRKQDGMGGRESGEEGTYINYFACLVSLLHNLLGDDSNIRFKEN